MDVSNLVLCLTELRISGDSGRQALADGKEVYYVTNVGVFRLTPAGLELMWLMPGIDVGRDILPNTTARLRIPDAPAVVDASVVTGRGFDLCRPPQ